MQLEGLIEGTRSNGEATSPVGTFRKKVCWGSEHHEEETACGEESHHEHRSPPSGVGRLLGSGLKNFLGESVGRRHIELLGLIRLIRKPLLLLRRLLDLAIGLVVRLGAVWPRRPWRG